MRVKRALGDADFLRDLVNRGTVVSLADEYLECCLNDFLFRIVLSFHGWKAS
jgi:hypothetical protein